MSYRSAGPRFIARLVALVSLFSVLAIAGPLTAQDEHPWPMRRADAARTGQSSWPGADVGEVVWKWKTSGPVPSLAADRGGRIHLGVTFNEEVWSWESYFTVLRLDRSVAWRRLVTRTEYDVSPGADSGPAITPSGRVIMNSNGGTVLEFDRRGREGFRIFRHRSSTNDSAPALFSDGSVAHYNTFDGGLAKYTAEGDLLWVGGGASDSDVAIAPNGDLALGGIRTNEPHGAVDIAYFNSNGSVRWSESSTFGTDGQAIFGADGTLFQGPGAYNPDGTVLWGNPSGGTGTLGKNGQYYLSSGQSVTAHNASTGAVLWTRSLPGAPGSIHPDLAVDSRDRIYLTTASGWVYSLEAEGGEILWGERITLEFDGGPIIAAESHIAAIGREGLFDYYVYLIR